MKMMKFKYGIFDLDGTIVNSIPTYTETFCEILDEKFGISKEETEEYYRDSTATPLDEQFRCILELKGKSKNKIPEMVKDFFRIVNEKDFVLFDGAKNVLKDLYERGIMLFVTTGSEDETTTRRLDKAGISKYFTLVLGSSIKEKGPWHIERFAKTAKVPMDEFSKLAFYAGDGPYDMHIAKMFGIYALGIPTTVSANLLLESGADEVVEKISVIGKLGILGK